VTIELVLEVAQGLNEKVNNGLAEIRRAIEPRSSAGGRAR
jgi:hypothetical protein